MTLYLNVYVFMTETERKAEVGGEEGERQTDREKTVGQTDRKADTLTAVSTAMWPHQVSDSYAAAAS